MAGKFLVAFFVTAFITTSVDAAAQGTGAKVQDPLGAKIDDPSADSKWSFDINASYVSARLTELAGKTDGVKGQLQALNYNTVRSEVDDRVPGWRLGAGFTWEVHPAVGIRPGFSLSRLGAWTAHVEGSRTDQPNTQLNVAFDATSRFFDVNQQLFEILAPLTFGRVTVNPGFMVVFVNGKAEYTSRLLGAPLGQTPTTPVAAGNEQIDFSGWGWGWQAGASVAVNSHIEFGVAYEQTRVNDVIGVPSGSYIILEDVRTGQLIGRFSIRP